MTQYMNCVCSHVGTDKREADRRTQKQDRQSLQSVRFSTRVRVLFSVDSKCVFFLERFMNASNFLRVSTTLYERHCKMVHLRNA